MASPKRTPTEREHDLERIATLYLKGKRQSDIAVELGVSQPQVSYDLKEIHKRWRESALVSINEVKHRELQRIDLLELTYWDAWQRSIGEKTKTRTEKVAGPKRTVRVNGKNESIGNETSRASVEKDTLLGNPAYLQGVQWCIEQRCKIFGIYEATKITFDWRKAVEEQGHNAGDLFEHMVNAYIAAVNSGANGEAHR